MFFDEVDAIGGARFDDGAGGDNEVQRTMLEIVNQLDGFDARGNVKVRWRAVCGAGAEWGRCQWCGSGVCESWVRKRRLLCGRGETLPLPYSLPDSLPDSPLPDSPLPYSPPPPRC